MIKETAISYQERIRFSQPTKGLFVFLVVAIRLQLSEVKSCRYFIS